MYDDNVDPDADVLKDEPEFAEEDSDSELNPDPALDEDEDDLPE